MDILEGFWGRFRRREKQPPPISNALEGRSTSKVWTYEHFREYLLALGRGRQFLLPTSQYPDLIELSESWHEVLEDMRLRTKQGKEHFAVVGSTVLLRSLHLPKKPAVGTEGTVPSEVIVESHGTASRAGIDRIIGDIHTHPDTDHLVFSLGDLYGLVYPGSKEFVKAVVGAQENLYKFRSINSNSRRIL